MSADAGDTADTGEDPAPAGQPAPPTRADAAAWLAVAAGTLGALMATLDISIVNSSLPTIQGEIGASGTEGTWISTAYLVAEIIIIPLSGWLERLFGLRTFLLMACVLFVSFSMMCGFSDTLPMMIVGRVGQGFTGGALIPTAMTIIATRLPREQQAIGNAMFGATAILGNGWPRPRSAGWRSPRRSASYRCSSGKRWPGGHAGAAADEAAALSRQRYAAGTTTLIDLLDAQRQQIEAEQSLSIAEAGLTGDFVAIQKALGLGWSDPVQAAGHKREIPRG